MAGLLLLFSVVLFGPVSVLLYIEVPLHLLA